LEYLKQENARKERDSKTKQSAAEKHNDALTTLLERGKEKVCCRKRHKWWR